MSAQRVSDARLEGIVNGYGLPDARVYDLVLDLRDARRDLAAFDDLLSSCRAVDDAVRLIYDGGPEGVTMRAEDFKEICAAADKARAAIAKAEGKP